MTRRDTSGVSKLHVYVLQPGRRCVTFSPFSLPSLTFYMFISRCIPVYKALLALLLSLLLPCLSLNTICLSLFLSLLLYFPLPRSPFSSFPLSIFLSSPFSCSLILFYSSPSILIVVVCDSLLLLRTTRQNQREQLTITAAIFHPATLHQSQLALNIHHAKPPVYLTPIRGNLGGLWWGLWWSKVRHGFKQFHTVFVSLQIFELLLIEIA